MFQAGEEVIWEDDDRRGLEEIITTAFAVGSWPLHPGLEASTQDNNTKKNNYTQ